MLHIHIRVHQLLPGVAIPNPDQVRWVAVRQRNIRVEGGDGVFTVLHQLDHNIFTKRPLHPVVLLGQRLRGWGH